MDTFTLQRFRLEEQQRLLVAQWEEQERSRSRLSEEQRKLAEENNENYSTKDLR